MNESTEAISAPSLRGRRAAGLVLLVTGVAALLGRYLPVSAGQAVPLLLGLAFLVWSLLGRSCGLLIPGGILTGLGTGLLLREAGGDNSLFLLCFAGGWGLISLLSLAAFRRPMWWPLFPAGALLIAGLTQMAGSETREWLREARPYWPVALIGIALFLLLTKPPEKE